MNKLFSVIKIKINNGFMKNTNWLIFENVFRMSISLIITGIMARYLGSRDYGLLSYGIAYISIFTVICRLGIDGIIVNEIIKNREKTGEIIGTTIILRLISSFLSITLIYFIVRYLNPYNKVLQMITLIQSISLIFISFDVFIYWFQSNLQSKYVVIAKSSAFFIISMWRLFLIIKKSSVKMFATATIIESIVISICIFRYYYNHGGQELKVSINMGKKLLSNGYHFIISGLLITVYTQMDKIMLQKIGDESMVGIYTAAMTIANLWVFIPNSIIESARPMIMTNKLKNEKRYKKRYKQLYTIIIWISIIASITITIFSKLLILLIFGQDYLEASNVLNILTWSRIFSLIGVTRSIWFVSENKIKYQKYFVGTGAIVNVLLNILLIPRYGALGAAIGTIFAEFISSTIVLCFFKETRPLLKIIINAFILKDLFEKDI